MLRFYYKYVLIFCSCFVLSSPLLAEDDGVVGPHKGKELSNKDEIRRIRQGYMHEVGISNYSKKKPNHKTGLRIGANSTTHHLFGVYTNIGIIPVVNISAPTPPIALGQTYGVGFCYEFQRYVSKAQIGIGYSERCIFADVNDIVIMDEGVADAWGYPYTLRYDFQNRKDFFYNRSLQIPLLFGAAVKHFYMMAGVKFRCDLTQYFKVSAIGSTSAVYEQFFGDFVEMDNHGLRKNVPIKYEKNIEGVCVDFNMTASIELGAEFDGNLRLPGSTRYVSYTKSIFDRKPEWRVRVAMYCDVGAFRFKSEKYNPLVVIPNDTKWDFNTFEFNHFLYAQESQNLPLCDISVGIKMTVLFGWYLNSVCRQCSSDGAIRKIANR